MVSCITRNASYKTKAIVHLLKAFDISFELFKNKDSIEDKYDPLYVKKILEAHKNDERFELTEELKKELFGNL